MSFTDFVSDRTKALLNLFDPTIQDTTLGQSQYNFENLTFPGDLGMEHNNHYMVININVPTTATGKPRNSFGKTTEPLNGGSEYSKVDVLRFSKGPISDAFKPDGYSDIEPGPGVEQREILSIPRGTRRIAASIALYMPNSLVYTSMNKYSDISLTALGGDLIGATSTFFGGLTGGALRGAAGAALGAAAGNAIGNLANLLSSSGSVIQRIGQITGFPINPRTEILFSKTEMRQFVFNILLAPRNENESKTIKKIVKTLKFHSAPEIGGLGGLLFVPPAEFDITFYRQGQENMEIPRINTCVMDRFEVDYTPAGSYSAYNTGHPMCVQISMSFTEVEILHKLRVAQGM